MNPEIVALARRLPVRNDEKNIARLMHTEKHGHIVTLKVGGDLLGYAEVYRLKEIPTYPVIPFPVDDPEGKILYCFAAVCERGFIKDLMKLGFDIFKGVDRIVYHRRKHGNRLYQIERF
jgi:hypothetical protein